jgi:nucleoside-diphosphate-sugar epimerase
LKRVLLTGASGFIGRHCLTSLLSRGYEVHAVCNKLATEHDYHIKWHQADLLSSGEGEELIGEVRPSHLLHLAWNVQPPAYWKSPENLRWVQASLSLIDAFVQTGGERIVTAGSCFEYEWHYDFYQEEVTLLLPTTLYGVCKNSLRMIFESYAKQSGVSAAWGRIFFPYGPYEHPNRLVPSVINALLKGEEAHCTSGEQVRDFLYVEDVADAFAAMLDSEVQGAVNIASGKPVAVKEVVLEIGRQLNKSHLLRLGSLPLREGDPNLMIADIKRLTEEVGWMPTTDLVNGIEKTIAWWK